MATKPLSVTRKHRCYEAEVSESYLSISVAATYNLESQGYSDDDTVNGKPAVIVSIGTSDRAMSLAMAAELVGVLNEAIAAAKGGVA